MKRVFLAYSFRDEDRELVTFVEHLLASHDVLAVTGEAVGGGGITPTVQSRIQASDGLIALLTRGDPLAEGGWTTHPWVRDELIHARGFGKPAIALCENGVPTAGMYSDHERIDFARDRVLDALLALSRTLGEWRRRSGRTLKVQILPEDVAAKLGAGNGAVQCRYRFIAGDNVHEWQDARPIPEVGGTFVYVRGVQDHFLIQLEVGVGPTRWYSPATSQFLPVLLRAGGGG